MKQTSDAYPTPGLPTALTKHNENQGEMAAMSPQRTFQILIHPSQVLRVAQQLLHFVRRVRLSPRHSGLLVYCWLGPRGLAFLGSCSLWLPRDGQSCEAWQPVQALCKEKEASRLLLPRLEQAWAAAPPRKPGTLSLQPPCRTGYLPLRTAV